MSLLYETLQASYALTLVNTLSTDVNLNLTIPGAAPAKPIIRANQTVTWTLHWETLLEIVSPTDAYFAASWMSSPARKIAVRGTWTIYIMTWADAIKTVTSPTPLPPTPPPPPAPSKALEAVLCLIPIAGVLTAGIGEITKRLK